MVARVIIRYGSQAGICLSKKMTRNSKIAEKRQNCRTLHNFVSTIKLKLTLYVFEPLKVMSIIDRKNRKFLLLKFFLQWVLWTKMLYSKINLNTFPVE